MSNAEAERIASLREAVTNVLMNNDAVRDYLYSEWDDGAEVGVLADQILAAVEES